MRQVEPVVRTLEDINDRYETPLLLYLAPEISRDDFKKGNVRIRKDSDYRLNIADLKTKYKPTGLIQRLGEELEKWASVLPKDENLNESEGCEYISEVVKHVVTQLISD